MFGRRAQPLARLVACALACAGCGLFVDTSEYEFGSGGAPSTSGGGEPGTTSGAGGAAATSSASMASSGAGGSACVPACSGVPCSPDGCGGLCETCGAGLACSSTGACCPSTWSFTTPRTAYAVDLASQLQSLYVGDFGGRVRRVSTCDGTVAPGSSEAQFGALYETRAVVKDGGTVFVVGANTDVARVYPRDALSLAESGEAQVLPSPAAPPSNAPSAATIGPDGALWIATRSDGGGLVRFKMNGTTCYQDTAPPFEMGVENRGLVRLGDALVLALYDDASETTRFRAVDFLTPPADPCQVELVVPGFPDTASAPLDVARSGAELIYGGFRDLGGVNLAAVLGRSTAGGASFEIVLDSSPEIDAFTAVQSADTSIYAARAAGSIPMSGVFDGAATLARYAASFVPESSPITETLVAGVKIIWAVEVDDDGVYLAGQLDAADPPAGFVMKCTRDLECPALPNP